MTEFSVVFQNNDFVVVNKADNVNFHSEKPLPELTDVQEQRGMPGLAVLVAEFLQLEQIYPVHRLDKMTSGLVVFALNNSAASEFGRMFANREIEKYYLALAIGKPKKKQGWVKGDMQPARRGSWKLLSSQDNPAITQFISISVEPGLRCYLIKLHTGKTHQIRVALKSLGVPVLGDKRYQNVKIAQEEDRGYLHAFAIRFDFNGESYEFICPPKGGRFDSDVFQLCIADWKTPWKLF